MINRQEEIIMKLCKYFEIEFSYKSFVTGELFFKTDSCLRTINPFCNMNDCFMFIEMIIKKGYEFYLFFKQPISQNIAFKKINWISEIRLGSKPVSVAMEDYPEESIIKAIELFIDNQEQQ